MNWLQRWLIFAGVGAFVVLAAACNGDGEKDETTSPGVGLSSWSVTTQAAPSGPAMAPLLQGPPSGITVLAYGEATAKPDRAIIQLGVASTEQYYGPGPPTSGPIPEKVMQQLVDALAKADVNKDDIDANPNASAYFGSGAYALLTARIADLPRVEGVMDAFRDAVEDLDADEEYAVQYTNVRYTVQDCPPLEAEAREEALKDADARAQGYARLLGVSLGGFSAVSEVSAAVFFSPQGVASIGCRALEDLVPPGYGASLPAEANSPDEATVSVTLSVTYAIK